MSRPFDDHLNARLPGLIQRGDASRVHERVQLQNDACRSSSSSVTRLSLNHVDDPVAQVHGSDDQPAEVALAGKARQNVEEVADVGAELRPAGQ